MKKIMMMSDNVCKINNDEDKYIIRSGVWNHMEFILSRSEFEANDSNFDTMVKLLNELFEGIIIDIVGNQYDPYILLIVDQLLSYNVIKEVESSCDNDNKTLKSMIIVEEEFIELAKIFNETGERIIGQTELECLMEDNLLTNLDYIKKQTTIEILKEFLSEYTQLKVILSRPRLEFLESINRIAIELNIPWCLAYIDGNIATVAAFNSDYTACFECLEQHNSVRMNNYNSYLQYKKEQNGYSCKSMTKTDFMFLFSFLSKINEINYFDISSPLEGKVVSIYLPNFEVYSENIMRSPMCPACGHISVNRATNYNARTENIIKKILS